MCRLSSLEVSLICLLSAAAAAAADAALCCYIAVVAAAAVLLLPAAVRHRVPDGQISCWFIQSDPKCFLSLHSNAIFLMVLLGSTVSHLRLRFAHEYILGNYGLSLIHI